MIWVKNAAPGRANGLLAYEQFSFYKMEKKTFDSWKHVEIEEKHFSAKYVG